MKSDRADDDEVFVKKGRHGSENGSAKKPLIRGDSIQHLFCLLNESVPLPCGLF